eukprot:TRINITY_DN40058_c0_g1_i1.p1 TRINITY_DN40058_c0_g1~~TRINITY_DN40058_c0_g1_i1.p1  ORF type:complete len:228 (-),score=17.03 TRINITY_DN40058_c0_g1_i1:80-763(-)
MGIEVGILAVASSKPRKDEEEEKERSAEEAATRAMREWGRSKSHITHVVSNCRDVSRLVRCLGLNCERLFFEADCAHFCQGILLRHAKEIVQRRDGCRVLVVGESMRSSIFRSHFDDDDGCVGAMIVGGGALVAEEGERYLFGMLETCQSVSVGGVGGVREREIDDERVKSIGDEICENVEGVLDSGVVVVGCAVIAIGVPCDDEWHGNPGVSVEALLFTRPCASRN